MRLALVTSRDAPSLRPDDQSLIEALAAEGFRVDVVAWDDPDVSWSAYDGVLPRSLGSYDQRAKSIESWCETLERETRLVGGKDFLHRGYLHHLAHYGGVRIAGFQHLAPQPRPLPDIIVKPAVGPEGSGWFVLRQHASAETKRHAFSDMQASGVEYVAETMEGRPSEQFSFVFFGGELSHAVVRRPAEGGVFVQEAHGGSSAPFTPTQAQRAQLERMRGPLHLDELAYVRVDAFESVSPPWSRNADSPKYLHVVEAHTLDVDLFFRHTEGGEARMARALRRDLAGLEIERACDRLFLEPYGHRKTNFPPRRLREVHEGLEAMRAQFSTWQVRLEDQLALHLRCSLLAALRECELPPDSRHSAMPEEALEKLFDETFSTFVLPLLDVLGEPAWVMIEHLDALASRWLPMRKPPARLERRAIAALVLGRNEEALEVLRAHEGIGVAHPWHAIAMLRTGDLAGADAALGALSRVVSHWSEEGSRDVEVCVLRAELAAQTGDHVAVNDWMSAAMWQWAAWDAGPHADKAWLYTRWCRHLVRAGMGGVEEARRALEACAESRPSRSRRFGLDAWRLRTNAYDAKFDAHEAALHVAISEMRWHELRREPTLCEEAQRRGEALLQALHALSVTPRLEARWRLLEAQFQKRELLQARPLPLPKSDPKVDIRDAFTRWTEPQSETDRVMTKSVIEFSELIASRRMDEAEGLVRRVEGTYDGTATLRPPLAFRAWLEALRFDADLGEHPTSALEAGRKWFAAELVLSLSTPTSRVDLAKELRVYLGQAASAARLRRQLNTLVATLAERGQAHALHRARSIAANAASSPLTSLEASIMASVLAPEAPRGLPDATQRDAWKAATTEAREALGARVAAMVRTASALHPGVAFEDAAQSALAALA